MRERSHQVPGRAHEQAVDEAPVVGRTTLAEKHVLAERYAAKPMFDSAVEWEAIDEPALPEQEDRELLDAAPRAAKDEDEVAPPVDDPEAKEIVFADQHHDPHAKRYEKKRRHAERHPARHDRFNQGDVKSDKAARDVAGRPGVVVKRRGHKDGVFMLKHASATRYLFVKHGSKNIAQPFDTVDRDRLARFNYKATGKESDKGRKRRLLLNPSKPRRLVIEGKAETCVLSWLDGMTAAWIPVKQLAGDTSKILSAVRKRAADWAPHRVSNDPHELAKKSKQYVIRNDKVGRPTKSDEGDVLAAGAESGDNVTHYLGKDLRKPAFGAGGKRIENKNVTRSIVAICMNLPSGHTPPVAIDTAQAGESFFVMRDRTFHRQVPVFENGKHQANVMHHWVFGHLGMRDEHGKLVPDPSRRGWVPLRALADAAHLKTHEIEPRKPKS